MFCDRCGGPLSAGQNFCSVCGKSASPRGLAESSRIDGHIRLLSIFWFALAAITLVPGLVLIFLADMIANVFPPDVPAFVAHLLPIGGVICLALAAVFLLTGWGLLERASWARPLAIALACLSLLHMPLGTALGIYTLWVLLPERAEAEYRKGTAARLSQPQGL